MTIFDILTLIGGLALFLYGMNVMSSSLEKLSGGKLESVLERMTNNRIKGVLLGAGVTALVQSSSAVTVMAVGFVNSKIMSLSQVIGIIMGANIGTTITSWILSLSGIESTNVFISILKPSSFSPIFAIIGAALFMFSKKEKKKDVGTMFLGFAVLMFGMEFMSGAVEPLKDMPAFMNLFVKFSNPVLGVIVGAVLTAIIQSSSASIGILQALSVTGIVPVSAAFPIILGQNIGTCITVIISAIGTNKNAKRTAAVHLLFNVFGVAAAMVLFYGANAVLHFSFMSQPANVAIIAMIHSAFNIFATVILFPFGNQLEKLVRKIIKDGTENQEEGLVDERFLMSPSYAIDKVKDKCDEMANLARKNIFMCLEFIRVYSRTKDDTIKSNEKMIDKFEDELETYLVRISSLDLSIVDSMKLSKLSHAIGNFERIGDYGVNILKTKRKMHQGKIHFSPEANKELEVMSRAVREIVDNSIEAFLNDDIALARTVEPLEQVIDNLKAELRAKHSKRMVNNECSVENGILFFDIVNSFERIADHCSNLAVCIIELSQGSYQTHSYLKGVKNSENKNFMESFESYLEKYTIR